MALRSERARRSSRDEHPAETLRVRGRRYRVLQRLGRDQRQRLLVEDPVLRQRRLALVLPCGSSTVQHIHVLKRLPRTDELPQVLDYERRSEHSIVVLTWVSGIDLGEYLKRVQASRVVAPSPYEAVRLVRGLAHAINRLNRHAQVVHADLKPQNLILTRHPSRLTMIDFGSAWPIEQTLYRTDGDGFSPVYAAPELLLTEPQLPSHADQFSASVILYQLLTGEVPYSSLGGQAGRPGYAETFRDALEPVADYSPAVRALPCKLRRSLDAFLGRSLRLDPRERFSSSSSWLDAIEDLHHDLKAHERARTAPFPSRHPILESIVARLFGGKHQ